MPTPLADAPSPGPPSPHRGPLRIVAVLLGVVVGWFVVDRLLVDRRPIVVGLIHSLTGDDAAREKTLLDAETATLAELDAGGGLLGRPVRWVVADGCSDATTFARKAESLVRDRGACVIVGCARTGARKAVARVVEATDHLLVYPCRHEGLEQSKNVFYTGAVPSQCLGPGVDWLRRRFAAKTFQLLVADDAWGQAIAALAGDMAAAFGDHVAARTIVVRDDAAEAVAATIAAADADAVICTLDWGTTAAVVRSLSRLGIRPDALPILALPDDPSPPPGGDALAGVYTVVTGAAAGTAPASPLASDAAAAASLAIRLWAQAVRDAESTDVRQVRDALRHQSLSSGDGILAIDPGTQHTWQRALVVRIRSDGRQEAVPDAEPTMLRPVPFPPTRSRAAWERWSESLLRGWGGIWDAPHTDREAPVPRRPAGEAT